jgi:hypothetical protein
MRDPIIIIFWKETLFLLKWTSSIIINTHLSFLCKLQSDNIPLDLFGRRKWKVYLLLFLYWGQFLSLGIIIWNFNESRASALKILSLSTTGKQEWFYHLRLLAYLPFRPLWRVVRRIRQLLRWARITSRLPLFQWLILPIWEVLQ